MSLNGQSAKKPTGEPSQAASGVARRVDLDRLRTLACLSTFCYHAVQIFDLNPYYHIKSNTPSAVLDVAARLLHPVRMPLFFLIAGMVGAIAMQRLSNGEIVKRRAARLLPPLVLGVVLFTPWIKYAELLDGRHISWQGIVPYAGPPPDLMVFLRRYFTQMRWFSWSHMWFPFYLMLLSILLLPLFRWIIAAGTALGSNSARQAVAIAWPLAALIAVEIALRPLFPWHIPNLFWDWASVGVYVTCMVWGAMLVAAPSLEEALQRWLPVAIAATALALVLHLGGDGSDPVQRGIGRAMWLWSVLCVLIGLGPLLARGRIPGERFLGESALPIYVLHHLPLIAIGLLVKDLPWPVWQRYAVIVLGALLVTLVIYRLVVVPFDTVRLAFGMTPRPRTRGASA